MWDLWWTNSNGGRFSPSLSISPANHSTDSSTLIIIHHPGLLQWDSSGPSNIGLGSIAPPKWKIGQRKTKKKKVGHTEAMISPVKCRDLYLHRRYQTGSRAQGKSVVVKSLRYKTKGRGFQTPCGECIFFSNLPNPSCRTRPWGLLSL
jgi:hypothetical protein